MIQPESSAHLSLLRNQIDIQKVPFSDRGSRLLVLQNSEDGSLYVKLAERLTTVQPDIEAYLLRPSFIQDFYLINEKGEPLRFEVISYPQIIHLQTELGDFALVFQDDKTFHQWYPVRE